MAPSPPFALLLVAVVAFAVPVAAQTPPGGEVRAVRVDAPPLIDGVLDEPFWSAIPPVTGFRQRVPVDGAPASERTEARIAFDDRSLYLGFTFFDSEPDRIRRAILQRGGRIDKDDRVIIGLDTYHDRRNAYIFEVGALGTQDDALISDESLDREDWNWDGVFTTETTVNAEGWVLEMAIPFTTIRFPDTADPVMGIAFSRTIRRKNEDVVWPHIGQDYRAGIAQVSQYATLTGLEGVSRGRHIELKPYLTAGAQAARENGGFERETDLGLDFKYGITSNLTLDLTWNTDFAQVEADNVRINLTRFNLFFPEKREFFLERAGLFQFGSPGETEIFFSRRIGLDGGILGGGRLTGQTGPFSIGALALRTRDPNGAEGVAGGAWNSVVRLQANLNPRTTAGIIGTSLDAAGGRRDRSNRVVGADFVTRFWSSSEVRVWGARMWDSGAPHAAGDSSAGLVELTLENDLYGLNLGRTRVGKDFDPALGFVRRPDLDQTGIWAGVKPRFEASRWARGAEVWAGGNRITGTDGALQSREAIVDASFTFESGESVEFEFEDLFERLYGPARINARTLRPGDYGFRRLEFGVRTNDSRVLSASSEVELGGFWGGERTQVEAGVSVKTGPHLTVGADVDWNRISLPVRNGDFTTTLASVDVQGAVSRKLFAGALVQWDSVSRELQANVRVDWIHTPGSDLFVVLDTGYLTEDPLDPRIRRWTRRTGVVKLTWLKTF